MSKLTCLLANLKKRNPPPVMGKWLPWNRTMKMENPALVERRKLQGIPVCLVSFFQLCWFNSNCVGGQVTFRKHPAQRNDVKYLRLAPVPKRTSLMTFLTVGKWQISSEIPHREIASQNDADCTKGARLFALNALHIYEIVLLLLDLSRNKTNQRRTFNLR